MNWSILNVAEARGIVEALLKALPLEKYGYSLEPRDGNWDLQIEYSGPEGWQIKQLRVDEALLRDSRDERSPARRHLIEAWRDELLGAGAG